jgi:hypothetical protein
MGRTEVETSHVLETIIPIATSNDDHGLRKIRRMIDARGRSFVPPNYHLFPFYPIKQAFDVQSPGFVLA